MPTEPFDRALDNFRAIEKGIVPLLVILASLLGYWLSGRWLAPVTRIIETGERIGVQNFSRRLEVPPASDELRRLTETLSAMLQRIEASFGRIAQFTGDASHELRKSVSVIRTISEAANTEPVHRSPRKNPAHFGRDDEPAREPVEARKSRCRHDGDGTSPD